MSHLWLSGDRGNPNSVILVLSTSPETLITAYHFKLRLPKISYLSMAWTCFFLAKDLFSLTVSKRTDCDGYKASLPPKKAGATIARVNMQNCSRKVETEAQVD